MQQTESALGIWPVTSKEYHADFSSVSRSMLECFSDSARKFYAIYVAKTLDREPPSRAMELGTALHVRLLDLEHYAEQVVVAPDYDRRTKIGKKEWEQFELASVGKMVLTEEEAAKVAGMASSVMDHDVAGAIFASDGKNEVAIRWEDPKTRILCKAMFDRFIDQAGLIVDIKTAHDVTPDGFGRSAANFGYARQAAWYLAGCKEVFATTPTFLHVVVCNTPPYEVAVYELDERSLEVGRSQTTKDLEDLHRCFETDIWNHSFNTGVARLTLPRWAF